jgi:hypothetical protein
MMQLYHVSGQIMVRDQKRAIGARKYKDFSPQQLEKAVEAVKSGMSLRKAQDKFGVPRCSINRAITGKHTGKVGRPYVLSEIDQNVLATCISAAGDWGFPLTLYDIRLIVKAFLDRCGKREPRFEANLPGREFVMSFLQRHKNILSNKMCQNIKRSRAKVDHETINEYFDELNTSMADVPPNFLINYDETNITDDPGRKKVVVRRGCRHPERIIDHSKSSTSVMFAAAGDGTLLPPYITYKAENLYNTWTEHGPKGTVYNRSKSGWFTLEIFEDWFRRIALPYFSKFDQNKKKVMIGDNLASHVSPYILEECKNNNISFILLPPNSTAITQPLDVAFFRPLKIKWRQTLDLWKTKNRGVVPKDTFPRLLNKCIGDMGDENIAKNVISGFKGAGLIPLNRDEVLKRLPRKCDLTDIEEADNSIAWVASFEEYLEESRKKETEGVRKQPKKKLNVPAGRGVGKEDVLAFVEKTKNNQRKNKKVLRSKVPDYQDEQSTSLKKHKITPKRPVNYDSDDEVDSPEEISTLCQDSSDDDFETFRAKQLEAANEEDDDQIMKQPELLPIAKEVGYFVIINYNENFYPGVIENFNEQGATVSAMMKTHKGNWKWPGQKDELFYSWEDIVGGINPPKLLNKRGFFIVPEMNQFN